MRVCIISAGDNPSRGFLFDSHANVRITRYGDKLRATIACVHQIGMEETKATSIAGGPIVKQLYSATANSLRGIVNGVRTERAIREELALMIVGVPLALVLAPDALWGIVMIGALLVVLVIEFLNTAVETLADCVTREWQTEIGRVKDFGSAAVFCALSLAGLIWLAAIGVRCGLL